MGKRQPVEFYRNEVRFIAEQDGEIEQEFKRKLTGLFQDHTTVMKAYLAVVDYGTPATFTVAVCLRAFPRPDKPLVQSISTVFSAFQGGFLLQMEGYPILRPYSGQS